MVLRVRDGGEERIGRGGGDAGDEQAVRLGQQGLRDTDDLVGGFAFAEDDFGHPIAQGAVMVELRIADIFVGEVAQFPYGRVNFDAASGDRCE